MYPLTDQIISGYNPHSVAPKLALHVEAWT